MAEAKKRPLPFLLFYFSFFLTPKTVKRSSAAENVEVYFSMGMFLFLLPKLLFQPSAERREWGELKRAAFHRRPSDAGTKGEEERENHSRFGVPQCWDSRKGNAPGLFGRRDPPVAINTYTFRSRRRCSLLPSRRYKFVEAFSPLFQFSGKLFLSLVRLSPLLASTSPAECSSLTEMEEAFSLSPSGYTKGKIKTK